MLHNLALFVSFSLFFFLATNKSVGFNCHTVSVLSITHTQQLNGFSFDTDMKSNEYKLRQEKKKKKKNGPSFDCSRQQRPILVTNFGGGGCGALAFFRFLSFNLCPANTAPVGRLMITARLHLLEIRAEVAAAGHRDYCC